MGGKCNYKTYARDLINITANNLRAYITITTKFTASHCNNQTVLFSKASN